ncbi:MAG TPA: hypothetical protein VM123_07005 [archaeon]|nr:hypothetical protein [archaeon]
MSLISHWKARKKFLGYTAGRPVWWLILLLILVLIIMYWLGRLEQILPK